MESVVIDSKVVCWRWSQSLLTGKLCVDLGVSRYWQESCVLTMESIVIDRKVVCWRWSQSLLKGKLCVDDRVSRYCKESCLLTMESIVIDRKVICWRWSQSLLQGKLSVDDGVNRYCKESCMLTMESVVIDRKVVCWQWSKLSFLVWAGSLGLGFSKFCYDYIFTTPPWSRRVFFGKGPGAEVLSDAPKGCFSSMNLFRRRKVYASRQSSTCVPRFGARVYVREVGQGDVELNT